jgi:arginase
VSDEKGFASEEDALEWLLMQKKKIYDSLAFLENTPRQETISILPIPLDLGSDNGDDLAHGPQNLLDLGLSDALTVAGLKTKILPEVHASRKHLHNGHKEKNDLIDDLTGVLSGICDTVHAEIRGGNVVVTLGGDHALSVGTIAGASKALKGDLGVIWIDVHGDIHTHATSLSQNPHGMSVTAIMGMGDKRLAGLVDRPIKKSNVLTLGYRDLEQREIDTIRENKIWAVTMFDVAMHGPKVLYDAVEKFSKKTKNIWVSLDLDAIDESVAPASAMASPGGFTHREIVSLTTYIGKTCNVVGLDIVELAPSKDEGNKTAMLAFELIAAALGAKSNWYTQYMSAYHE